MRANKLLVTTEIASILKECPVIKALIGDKIFPIRSQEGTTGDFILYKRDKYEADWSKMGKTSDKCEVYINVISDDYDRCQKVAVAVQGALEGEFSQPDMIIRLLDSTEDYVDGKYVEILLFSIE